MTVAVATHTDRMTFALFLALMLHAMVLLGVSFAPETRESLATTLEVTLANYKSADIPDEADFLAQESQLGSGTLEEAKRLATDVQAPFDSNNINEASPLEQALTAPKETQSQQNLLSTNAASDIKTQSRELQDTAVAVELPEGPEQMLLEKSLEMASLEARLDNLRQAYSKRPRVQRLTATSTLKAADAYYVNNWRTKIERMGTLNYPREAEGCVNNCRLRVLVAINADGSISSLEVLESSGKKVLDDAALRIVRMSAPFAPFTDEMRQNTDILEIIRTWQFQGNRYLSGDS